MKRIAWLISLDAACSALAVAAALAATNAWSDLDMLGEAAAAVASVILTAMPPFQLPTF
ncbi:MAG TPA: hypothetical protein VIL65_09890 [Beijerinckiaceae bacterium]|jgi:hypothetical protein